MARQAREKSSTGIYHIMLRGIDGRNLFLDNEDRRVFIEKLLSAKTNGGFKLYGFCLMDNHVHLLMKESEDIGTSIKRITIGYVQWHNNKHGRTGHLFQNRYNSEVVESEDYLLTVLRYIHNNPQKAKIVKNVGDYPWSSYRQYLLEFSGESTYLDAELIVGFFLTRDNFVNFMNIKNDDKCLDYKPLKKYTDASLKELIHNQYNLEQFREMSPEAKNLVIKKIYQTTGASIRQIGRVMGIGKNIIERAIK